MFESVLGKSQEGENRSLGETLTVYQILNVPRIEFSTATTPPIPRRYAMMTIPQQPSRAVDGVNIGNLTLSSTITNFNNFLILAQTQIDHNPN